MDEKPSVSEEALAEDYASQLYRSLLGTQSETIPQLTARSVAADTVMAVAGRYLIWGYGEVDEHPRFHQSDDLDEIFRFSTEDKCGYASIRAIDAIWRDVNRRILFERFLLLQGNSSEKPFSNKEWVVHTVAVLKSTDGNWFILSPSNFDPEAETSGPVDVIEEGSLQIALDKLQERDGGIWPSSTELEEGLQESYVNPEVRTRYTGDRIIWGTRVMQYDYRDDRTIEHRMRTIEDSFSIEEYIDQQIGDPHILRLDPVLEARGHVLPTVENWGRFDPIRAAFFRNDPVSETTLVHGRHILSEFVERGGSLDLLYGSLTRKIRGSLSPLVKAEDETSEMQLLLLDSSSREEAVRQRMQAVFTFSKGLVLLKEYLTTLSGDQRESVEKIVRQVLPEDAVPDPYVESILSN